MKLEGELQTAPKSANQGRHAQTIKILGGTRWFESSGAMIERGVATPRDLRFVGFHGRSHRSVQPSRQCTNENGPALLRGRFGSSRPKPSL